MRKLGPVLVLLALAAFLGFALGGVGLDPVLAAVAGVIVVGGAAATRVPTDRILWAAACLFVVTVTWNGIRLAGGAFGNAFLVLAALALAAHVIVSRRPLPLPPWLMLAGIGLFLAQLLSLVFPPDTVLTNKTDIALRSLIPYPVYIVHRPDVSQMVKFEVSMVVVPVLLMTAADTYRRCSRLLDLFAISASVSAAIGFVNHLGIDFGPGTVPVDGRAAGLAIHPNYLAVGATIALPAAMLWLARADIRWRLAGAVAVPSLLAGVFASGSRAGALTALAAVGLTTWFVPRLRLGLRLALPLAGMVLVFVLAFTDLGHVILDQVRLSGDSNVAGSNFQRRVAADVAFAQISDRPLQGVGFSVIADAHDIYLELLAAGGVIALTAFLVFCGGLVGAAARALRGPGRDMAVAASVGILLWLVGGVVGNEVADKFLYVVPGILLAIARVTWHERRAAPPAGPADVAAGDEDAAPPRTAEADRPRVPVPA